MDVMQQKLMDLSIPEGIKSLDKISDGYKAYQTLAAALDLELFDWLDEKGRATREEIIDTLKINGMFARSFLQSLVELGLLTCSAEQYGNAALASSFLVKKSKHYQGDWLRTSTGQSYKWNNLSEMLTKDLPEADTFSADSNGDYIKALKQGSLRGELQSVVKAIADWEGFSQARRVLDLSAEHGLYTAALCQLNSKLDGVVFEKPDVVEFTKKLVHSYGLEERVQVQGGSLSTDQLGNGYDIVLISHLLYKFRDNISSIFNKVFACLNPGGLLISNHWFCSPGCGATGGLQELDKSLHSFGHPLCHPEKFQALIQKMGFNVVHAAEVPSVYGPSKLFLAEKDISAAETETTSHTCCQR